MKIQLAISARSVVKAFDIKENWETIFLLFMKGMNTNVNFAKRSSMQNHLCKHMSEQFMKEENLNRQSVLYVIDILRLKHKSKFIFEQCMRRSGLMLVNCVVWALHRPLTWKLIWKENTEVLFDFFLSWNQFNWFKNVISTHLNYW